MRVRTILALTSTLLLISPLAAQEPRSLAFSGGVSNFNKSEKRIEAGLELRLPVQVWKLAFATGLTVNDDQSVWIFAGLRRDFSLGGPWLVTPAPAWLIEPEVPFRIPGAMRRVTPIL